MPLFVSLSNILCILQLIYKKLPADISSRHVLLLDPVLASGLRNKIYTIVVEIIDKIYIIVYNPHPTFLGNSAVKAISLLLSKGVPESSIIFLNLIAVSQLSFLAVLKLISRSIIFQIILIISVNAGSRRNTCCV